MEELSFDDSLVRRASALRLASGTLTDSFRSGAFKSMQKGQGIEFHGVREYLMGDDVRSIDWNVTARMGRPYVKQFNEDRELVLFVIVDASLSMETGQGKRSRLYTACEAAALTAFAASNGGGPVGGVIFAGDILFSREPKPGRDQVMLFMSLFDGVLQGNKKKGTGQFVDEMLKKRGVVGSCLDKALKGAASLLKKRSLILIFSDFRTTDYEKSLALLSSRHDVVAVRISDSGDEKLATLGTVPFMDPESGSIESLPTSSAGFQQAWKTANANRVERWQNLCYRRGAKTLMLSTDEDPLIGLQRFFSVRDWR